ncbi:hypothetical protein BIW11_02784 [Tropilaelaps mercedesae]|uniref:Uncharacterized protein n=1 Tax=Tropilaelaps mercedesae TaxID=418985 RepID=A0A1V9XX91_9ACAR|nr:hypothetical protein BIW11_02784 [Tropilaelaps mercedesae]
MVRQDSLRALLHLYLLQRRAKETLFSPMEPPFHLQILRQLSPSLVKAQFLSQLEHSLVNRHLVKSAAPPEYLDLG